MCWGRSQSLVGKIAAALAATGSVTLASGALVLMGAVAAGQRRRMAEAVVLKTLGATRRQIRAAWLVEFGLIGAAAGLIAAVGGDARELGGRAFRDAGRLGVPAGRAGGMTYAGVRRALMLGFGYAGTEVGAAGAGGAVS